MDKNTQEYIYRVETREDMYSLIHLQSVVIIMHRRPDVLLARCACTCIRL